MFNIIQLGCNYSKELIELLDEGVVELDWIKLSRKDVFWEEYAVARPIRPILLHILPSSSQPNLDQLNWDEINIAIEKCGSPHIAIHLSAIQEYWEKDEVSKEDIIERQLAGLELCKSKLSVELLVENVPYYGSKGTLKEATDPEVIRTICEVAGVGLLLDLAHLRVSAWHRQEGEEFHLKKLPLHLVKEIHINGPALDPVLGLRDQHLEMEKADYRLLDTALQHTNPTNMTLEYGGTGPKMMWRSDKETLKRQLLKLQKIIEE